MMLRLVCCDISMEVLGAHWDIRWRWPGAAELPFLGVWVTVLLVSHGRERAEDWPPESWRGELVCEGGPLAKTFYMWLDILWAVSWAAVGGCMEGIRIGDG